MAHCDVHSVEETDFYKESLDLSDKIKLIALKFPIDNDNNLSSQLISSSDGIIESMLHCTGWCTKVEADKFKKRVYNSGVKTLNFLNIAYKLKYIDYETMSDLWTDVDRIMTYVTEQCRCKLYK